MGKFCGVIGFSKTEETKPGVWTSNVTERKVYGDVIKNNSRYENSGHLNDNIVINNQVSFIADPFTRENFQTIIYCKLWGICWKVTNITVEFPRLILTLGGEYNAE